jgi:glycosyltransferase involved in cell wall biosynthesis
MKVCHLIDHMGLGGAQSVVADLVEARGSHIQPYVISLRNESLDKLIRRIRDSGASYQTLSLNKWNPIGVWRLRNSLSHWSFDLVHTHLEYSNTFGVIAAGSLGQQRPRIVRHIHADPWAQNSPVARTVMRATTCYVDAHIAPGPTVAAMTASMLGSGPDCVNTIRNGIDIQSFETTPIDSERVRSLRAGARRVVGFVGRLAESKDLVTLIDSMTALLAAEPSTRLLIVGDGPLKAALIEYCREKELSHAVTFTGYLENIAEAYQAMDVLAFATKYEGLPISLIEAMVMRTPVVAAAVPGVTDIVVDGETGLLAAPADVQSMVANLLRLFDIPGLAESLQNTAYEIVRKKYSRCRMVDETERLYADLVPGAN